MNYQGPPPDSIDAGHTGPRCWCGRPADWQLGAYIPFRCTELFYCDRHLPAAWREEHGRQEADRARAEARML